MRNSLQLLERLARAIEPLPAQKSPPTRLGRRMVRTACSILGASGGAICAWRHDLSLAFCATRALEPGMARRLRHVVHSPPANLVEVLGGIDYITASQRKRLASGWSELDQLVQQLASSGKYIAVWPLSWLGRPSLLLLIFSASPGFRRNFGPAAAGYLGLALGNMHLQRRVVTRSEDYRRIFENSRDMVYLSSRDGRWQDVNPAGVEMLGYDSLEQLLAVPDSARAAYLDPSQRTHFMNAIEKDGFVKDYEVAFKKRDGTPFFVSITAQVREEDGRVAGYEGIIKDVTARKEADRHRQLVASILSVAPVAIFMVDANHKVLHWNRACEQLTGVKREEILGTADVWKVFQRPPGVSLADVVVDQDWDRLRRIYGGERLRRGRLSDEAWEAEAHFQNLGGRAKDLIFTAALLRDGKGQVLGAVEAIMDSTQIKELERSLSESERLYRTLVESNREGIALHDGEGFIFANQAFLDMFALESLDQAPGDFLDLLAQNSRKSYLKWLRNMSVLGGTLPIFQGQGLRGEGPLFDLEAVAAPAPYKGREAILFTIRDVTRRKHMEEQLIRSERLAATGKLAFDIAHEVNNPLGGIITYAHLLAEDLESQPDHLSTVEKIIKLANRCKIIVRGLLDFAREDSPEKHPMDLNEVLKEMLSLVDQHIIMRNVELSLNLDPELPTFYGLRNKIEQVFLNLVINAAEAMEGKGLLELTSWADRDDGFIYIRFRDHGPGMAKEAAQRIFEPFYTTKARGRGTGLGLAISHGIIKQHEGRIEVETEPGQGASFTLVLPLESP